MDARHDDAARASGEEPLIEPGTRVRLQEHVARGGRPHLEQHARHRDTGVVVTGDGLRVPGGIYVIVRFESCRQNHRLLPDEIEPAD